MPSPASPKRVLICEGLEGACFPEVRYVVQGHGDDTKVCVFEGAAKLDQRQLHEAVGSNFTIVESTDKLVLVEREGKNYVKDGRWFVEGVFQRSDVKNANGRVYSRKIWERHIANAKSPVQENVKQRGMVGVFEHPGDGRTRGPESALVVTDLRLQEDGTVWGKAELLDTPNGLILQELTAKKVRWGVSSRGTGTIDDKGNVSESDYQVDTWDAVMRPSTPGAFPRPVGESGKVANESTIDESRKALFTTISEALDKPLDKSVAESQAAAVRYVADMLKTAEPLIAPEEQEDAHSVFKLICKRVSEAETAVLAAAVNESARVARGAPANESASTPALAGVLEHLRTRVAAALQEAAEANSRLAALEDEAGQSRRKLQEAERENVTLKAKLAAATAVIASRSRRSVDEGSTMTVTQYIDEIPELAKYRTVLEAADSTKLDAVVEALLPEALAEPTATDRIDETDHAPARRSILPHGLQISESLPAKKPVGAGPALNEQDQQRVRVAAAAVARMSAAPIVD